MVTVISNGIRDDVAPASHYQFEIPAADLLLASGDRVTAGMPLSQARCPDHAPVAGEVRISGLPGTTAILTISAGPMAPVSPLRAPVLPPLQKWREATPEQLIDRIAAAGIRGLGGGSFPTYLKLEAARAHGTAWVIANGVECEAGIRCDSALWSATPESILNGLDIIRTIVQPEHCTLALGDHLAAPTALPAFIEYQCIESTIPAAGEERRLIEYLTGNRFKRPDYPTDHGFLCLNIGTLHAIHEAVVQGQPLTHRIVTLPGGNFNIPIGYPIQELLKGDQIRIGGRWSGNNHPSNRYIDKGTNAVSTVPTEPNAACIRCGRCRDACPEKLLPDLLLQRARTVLSKSPATNVDPVLIDLALNGCIECGLCDASCPSEIQLVQDFRAAKRQQARIIEDRQGAERAKLRHAAHQQRATASTASAATRRDARLRKSHTW